MPPNRYWNCKIANTLVFTSLLWASLLIVSMTFERFYSIIRPHKAASFNTVKRAKISIVCIIIVSTLYNIPHFFISMDHGRQCIPYATKGSHVEIYYWFSFVVQFVFPFISLLAMNTVIIHTLNKRLTRDFIKSPNQSQIQSQSQGQSSSSRMKSSEKQIFIMLLLVTFGFLILTTPAYLSMLYVQWVGYGETPAGFGRFYLFYQVGQKAIFTNNAINFFFYVLSGQKFRNDLMKLFRCCRKHSIEVSVSNKSTSEINISTRS